MFVSYKTITIMTHNFKLIVSVATILFLFFSCNTDNSEIADTEKPTAPSELKATEISKNSFVLNWKKSTDNVGVTEYVIHINGNKLTTNDSKYTFTGLQPATSYSVSLEAKDAAGNISEISQTLLVVTEVPDVDVYLSGNSSYLKNGNIFDLEGINGFSSKGSLIFVGQNNIYNAGNISSNELLIATYWKNGKINFLEPSNSTSRSTAEDLAIYGNDVYIAGSVTQYSPYYYYKCYWKNGIKTILEQSTYSGSYSQPKNSVMKVYKGDIYIASQNYSLIYHPVYWKNGVMERLSFSLPINNVQIECIDVENDDVYIAGSALNVDNVSTGFYWKNKQFQLIPGSRYISAIDVVGNDVYVAGITNNGNAAYWKNGLQVNLSYGQTVTGIQVMYNDVYVSTLHTGEGTSVAKIFKNGTEIYSANNLGYSKVFVAEK